jgi:hypothetical protein
VDGLEKHLSGLYYSPGLLSAEVAVLCVRGYWLDGG